MPRRETPFLCGQYYHLYNRGNNRQAIFFEADNYEYFLYGIKKHLLPYMDILAYCLMPTHYHILGRVREFQTSEVFCADVSRGMQRLGISYTKAMNKRFGRVGVLFQGQFQAKIVGAYDHLLKLCLYIHGNPVKDGIVSLPEEWDHSNYLDWINLRDGTLIDREFIRENFGSPEEYRLTLSEYLKSCALPFELAKQLTDLEG